MGHSCNRGTSHRAGYGVRDCCVTTISWRRFLLFAYRQQLVDVDQASIRRATASNASESAQQTTRLIIALTRYRRQFIARNQVVIRKVRLINSNRRLLLISVRCSALHTRTSRATVMKLIVVSDHSRLRAYTARDRYKRASRVRSR